LLQHDRAVPHVEHHPRLDGRAEQHHVARIADHHAAVGNPIARLVREVRGVGHEQVLEGRDEVVAAVQQHPVQLDLGTKLGSGLPARAFGHPPAHRLAVVDQACRARGKVRPHAGRGEVGPSHQSRSLDRLDPLHGGHTVLGESV
jgi:hypothetical protein